MTFLVPVSKCILPCYKHVRKNKHLKFTQLHNIKIFQDSLQNFILRCQRQTSQFGLTLPFEPLMIHIYMIHLLLWRAVEGVSPLKILVAAKGLWPPTVEGDMSSKSPRIFQSPQSSPFFAGKRCHWCHKGAIMSALTIFLHKLVQKQPN